MKGGLDILSEEYTGNFLQTGYSKFHAYCLKLPFIQSERKHKNNLINENSLYRKLRDFAAFKVSKRNLRKMLPYWNEIKVDYKHEEFIASGSRLMGNGLLYINK